MNRCRHRSFLLYEGPLTVSPEVTSHGAKAAASDTFVNSEAGPFKDDHPYRGNADEPLEKSGKTTEVLP